MLARKALLHFVNTVVGGILGALALKLVALYMGDAILGRVAYALALLNVVQTIFTMGFRNAHEKRMGEGGDQGTKIATYLYLQFGLSTAFALAVATGVGVWTIGLGKSFESTTLMTIAIVAAYLMAQNIRQVSVNTFNGRREIARSQTITFLDDLVRVGVTVVAASVYGAVVRGKGPFAGMIESGPGWLEAYASELLAMTYLAGTATAALVGLFYLWRTCPIDSFDRDTVTNYWAYARPIFFTFVIGSMATNVDRIMLGYFWTDSEIGLFFGMDRVTHIIRSLGFALSTVLVPTVSGMSVEGNRRRISEIIQRSHRYTMMTVLPMALGAIVFARPLIRILLADEFLRGTWVLIILTLYVLVLVLQNPYTAGINGMDRPRLTLRLSVFAFAVNVVLNLVLIPADIQSLGISLVGLGAIGAAIATLTSQIVKYAGARYFIEKLIPMDHDRSYIVRQLLAGGVMAVSLWWLSGLVPGLLRWYHLLVAGPLGLAIYVPVLWLLGGIDKEDVDFFLGMLNPAEMWTYVKDELLGLGDDD